ncbi:hypothetical protein HOLleu_12406 [Holothuria leucospilota]|uniref:Uncharacterized protein n=1 Tax=Holothuria leucospilota TaxID=206669 RepID=A0A9Q1HDU9_HOLLE|nr:hypothetical protein HOLleu_12406 [Holothuria leucospilota]
MAENPSKEGVKDVSGKLMSKYEYFMISNDENCKLLDEEAKTEHLSKWCEEKETYIMNTKNNVESWFASKSEEEAFPTQIKG